MSIDNRRKAGDRADEDGILDFGGWSHAISRGFSGSACSGDEGHVLYAPFKPPVRGAS